MSIAADIKGYKAQLQDFLSKKYVDQPLLLGFNSVVQAKFHAWIVADANTYYHSQEDGGGGNAQQNPHFSTIEYFEQLWCEFHYPIIKFFQRHHAAFFTEVLGDFEEFQKGRTNKEKAAFRVKLVEIRKINESFVKFVKQGHDFYRGLMKHFSVHFCNPLIPNQFLSEFDFEVPDSAVQTSNANLQANFVFLVHRCLLYLGNLSRHRAFIEFSYVNPCLSTGNFWKYKDLSHSGKTKVMKPAYNKAISYYKLCILLLPALNESYNHIGMIHNLVDEKYDAVYWFLRSQSTRIPDYTLGHANFVAVLKKDWFLLQLVAIYSKDDLSKANMGDLFVCLLGTFYMPEQYRRGKNIVRNISYSQVEKDFLEMAFNSFADDDKQVHLQQLVMMIAVQKRMELEKHENLARFNTFIGWYFEALFKASTFTTQRQKAKVLACSRLVFSFIRENKPFFAFLKTKEAKTTVATICDFVNSLLASVDSHEEDTSQEETISQDSTFNTIVELLKSSARPLRGYYFEEDVLLKDFLPIKFQFKDFKDDHLFASNNINLLVGDYSSYYSKSSPRVPSFLGNDTVTRISKRFEGTRAPAAKVSKVVAKEIAVYENDLRLQAVLAFSKKLLDLLGCYFDAVTGRFVRKTVEVKTTQKRPKKVSNKERFPKPAALSQGPLAQGTQKSQVSQQDLSNVSSNGSPEGPPAVLVNSTALPAVPDETTELPTSLEQIQSSILIHTGRLRDIFGSPESTVNTFSSHGNTSRVDSAMVSGDEDADAVDTSRAPILDYTNGSSQVQPTQDIATEVDHVEREQGLKSMVDSLVLEQNFSGSAQSNTARVGGNIWANGASHGEQPVAHPPQPMAFQNGPGMFQSTPEMPQQHPGVFQNPPMAFQAHQGPFHGHPGHYTSENNVPGHPGFAPGVFSGPKPPYTPYQQPPLPPYGYNYGHPPPDPFQGRS